MQTKHTPGPWFINGPYTGDTDLFIRTNIDGEGFDIATVNVDETGDYEANAKLIVAAPEILDVLILLNTELDKISNGDKSEQAKIRVEKAQRKSWEIIKHLFIEDTVYFQPDLPCDLWDTESGISSFQVYKSRENCLKDFPDYEPLEYKNGDIENPTYID